MNPTVLADIAEQDGRVAYLETLYLITGRAAPAHPQHGLYTGLIAERVKALLAVDRDLLASGQVE